MKQKRNGLLTRTERLFHSARPDVDGAHLIASKAAGSLALVPVLARRYSKDFIDLYIIPMGAAIWSTDPERMLSFPAQTFVRFLLNHGLTSLVDRPTWFAVEGGSMQYVNKLIAPFAAARRSVSTASSSRRTAAVLRSIPYLVREAAHGPQSQRPRITQPSGKLEDGLENLELRVGVVVEIGRVEPKVEQSLLRLRRFQRTSSTGA